MKVQGGNNRLKGTIKIPGDKSISHRSIMIGALSEGKSTIRNFLLGEDCLSTIACFKEMGVPIMMENQVVTVHGVGLKGLVQPTESLDVGNSGTTIRLMSGILAGQNFATTMTGDASIQKRPMDRIIHPLKKMGAFIQGKQGSYAPLTIKPTESLKGITYEQPIASAQVKSCILLGGLYAMEKTIVIQPKLSRDHTEKMLRYYGADLKVERNKVILQPGKKLIGREIFVPGDISSAAFFMVAGLILPGSEIVIENVGINPTRTGIIDTLRRMGGNIEVRNESVVNGEPLGDLHIKHSSLKGTTVEGNIIPRLIDEIPILAVAAAVAEGRTIIKDATELKVKESNRLAAIVTELSKMGVVIEELEDGLIIEGRKKLQPASFKTYGDHRMAMAMTIAALYADGQSQLEEIESIKISFPNFFDVLKKCLK